MDLGSEGSSEITFDNIDSSPPIDSGNDGFESGVEHVPAIPQDKLDNPEHSIAKDEGEQSEQKDVTKDTPKEDIKAAEGEEKPASVISINGENYDLAQLLENPELLQTFSQQVKDSELRRSDYSRKTAELARSREEFNAEKEKYVGDLTGYLDGMNSVFMETPRLFLLKTLGIDPNGQQLPPEQAEKAISEWISRLSGELKAGKDYNPAQLKKQYELEERLRNIEKAERDKAENAKKTEYEVGVNKLADHIKSKAIPSFSENAPISTVIEKLPWLKGKISEMALDKFNKAYSTEYVEGDPSWDDFKYVDNFNFNDIWSEIEKEFDGAYDEGRQSYISKKKEAARKKPAGSSVSSASSGGKEDSWTFDKLFG